MIQSARRRAMLAGGLTAAGAVALFGAGVADAAAKKRSNPAADVNILNAAIALEHEGIAAYTIAAKSGLLQPAVVQTGVTFRGHHQRHLEELSTAVRRLGGAPVAAKSEADYAEALNVAALKSQTDVLALALNLERGAANAYLGLIPSLGVDFHLIAGRMAADEAFHVAVLAGALGQPIPSEGLMFGA